MGNLRGSLGQNFDLLGYPKIGIFDFIHKSWYNGLKTEFNGQKFSFSKDFRPICNELNFEIVQINK